MTHSLDTYICRPLAIASFERSGATWYNTYYRAATAWAGAGRRPVDAAREHIDIVEHDRGDDVAATVVAQYEARMPSADEFALWLRDKTQPFARPRRRGRGTTNWERVQLIKSDSFKVALMEVARVVLAWPWAMGKCEQAKTDAEGRSDEATERGWTDTFPGWEARFDSMEQCEDPDDLMPYSEELRTWLGQIEDMNLLEALEKDTPLSEYA